MAEKITIARPYAQAIFELAREQDELGKWSEMLALCAAVASNEDMAALVDNPKLSNAQVAELFLEVCGDGLNDSGKSMIRTVAENDRIGFLPEIAELYEEARAQAEGTVQAEVVSATALSGDQPNGFRVCPRYGDVSHSEWR